MDDKEQTGTPSIEIDSNSGFCFGVVTAIQKAEAELARTGQLRCLGDIVHNASEVDRLGRLGLITINHADLEDLRDTTVLLRAHGEPPSTYRTLRDRNINVIDATCPVVLRLQRRIKEAYDQARAELETTMSLDGFRDIVEHIKGRKRQGGFEYFDTICRQVATRSAKIRDFAAGHDVVVFVTGAKSSNGKVLYEECRMVNPNTYRVTDADGLRREWLDQAVSIGVCGATSTPAWLMQQVADRIKEIINPA